MSGLVNRARVREDHEYWREQRLRAQTDLFFLAHEILNYPDMTEETHGPVADFFVHKDPRKPIAEQDKIKSRLLLMPRGTFKALALDTPIPTPRGFTTMGDVQLGDTLFSDGGCPTKVIATSPVYDSNKCFAIEFSTGEIVIADAGHLWVTESRRDRDNGKGRSHWKTRTTEEIAATVLCRDERNHRLKIAGPIRLPKANNFPIPPYVLGYWLGNGSSEGHSISCPDPEIIEEIRREGEVIRYAELPIQDPLKWVFNGGPGHPDYKMRDASFAGRLRSLNLYKNKHIPTRYMRGSIEQRLALLQGLLDSDGTASKRDGRVTFSNTNLRLAVQTRELIQSLGYKAFLNGPYEATIDGEYKGDFYHVNFKPYAEDAPVFRLPRKLENVQPRPAVSLQNYRQIVRVEEISSVPVRCLQVDAPSHQFLVTDGFIPTHNTTLNISDSVQWMVDFPDIRILALTASNSDDSPLADAFVNETAGHFRLQDYSAKTLFHDLFPECVHTGKMKQSWFINPARTRTWREPSLFGASIEQSLSGWHFDVIKTEDIQDNRNSQTSYGIRKIRQNLFINLKMLMPWGYRESTGTRYGPEDVYGYMIEKLDPAVSKVMWKPAMEPKPHARKKYQEDPDAMSEEDWDLFFPEMLPYSFLMEKKSEDLHSYMTQYMNIATGSFVPTFDIERLHMISLEQEMLPLAGEVYIAWKLETDSNPTCAGMVGMRDNGRLYMLDCVRGQYKPSTLAHKIVHLAKVYGCHNIEIEETPGAHHHEQNIRKAAIAAAWSLNIRWLEFDDDPNVRQIRIKSVEPLIKDGWVWMSKNMPHLNDTIRQLHHYGISDQNELPDIFSRLCAHLPASSLLSDREDVDDLEAELARQRDLYDRLYGLGQYSEPEAPEVEDTEYQSPWDKGELDEIMPGLSG